MPGITAILTAYRRAHTIRPLVDAVRAQTVPASQIWAWANEPLAAVAEAVRAANVDRVVTSSVNAFFHARFALALTAPTEFVAMFDDDSVPGARWFENCLAIMERTPGIVGSAGVRLVEANYATATKHGWHAPAAETVAVDLVGHAWLLRTEWLHYLFDEPAVVGTNGEDIELAARAMRLGGIPCYCPPHPPTDRSLWGSTRGGELGDDDQAAFRRVKHVAERDQIVRAEIAAGWKPLFMRGRPASHERTSAGLPARRISEEITEPAPASHSHDASADLRETDRSDVELAERLLAVVPASTRRILLIGSRDLTLARCLKQRSGTEVVAIVPDVHAADHARPHADRVIVGTPATQPATKFDASFDCVICGELDQFRDPVPLLARARAWLRPGGTIVAAAANVRHAGVVEGLIEGNWPRARPSSNGQGVKRPLRFYTRRELEKLLFQAGFHLDQMESIPGPGYAEWDQSGRPGEVRVGPLHIAGMQGSEAEEFYAGGFVVAATPEIEPGFGLTSIVILTHNQLEYTRQCIESIRERTTDPVELIVVDNGSTDGTVDYLHSLSGVRATFNAENLGFPIAANQGIRAATGRQILLLNNDTIVTTGWLRRMLRALASDRRIGLVGACSNNVSGSQQVTVSYDDLTSLDGFAWDYGKSRDRVVADTDRLVGFCLLIRREVVDKIGVLDEQFTPGNFEDDDYCQRALEAGFRVVIARDAFVHHFAGRTFVGTGVSGSKFGGLIARNQKRYREKLRAKELQRGGGTGWLNGRKSNEPGGSAKYRLRAGSDGAMLLERSRVRLSLCLIMRDNEHTIAPCLESIRPWVDELVCLDTGSTDATPRIAERLGARVQSFAWCDSFSAARNESFRHARGEWIFWMDSDDTIDAANGRAMRLLALGETDPANMAFTMKVHCPGTGKNGDVEVTAVDQVKLIRNFPEIRWDRRIHEQIIPAIRRAGGEILKTDLYLVHSGSDHSDEGKRRKLDRDLRLLHLELQEFPDHPFTLFNLGMTYRDAQQYDEAINYLRRSIERSGECESHLRKAYALLVSSYSLASRNAAAFETCQQALKLFPNDSELRFQEGGLLSEMERYADAAESYQRVLATPEDVHFASVEQGICSFLTRHNLAVAYTNLGRLNEAKEQLRLAIAESPTFRRALRALADVLHRTHEHEEARVLAEQWIRDERLRGDALLLKGQLAVLAGDSETSRHWFEEAIRLAPEDIDLIKTICSFLCTRGNASEAKQFLEYLVQVAPDDASGHHDLGTLRLQMGDFTGSIECLRTSLRCRPVNPQTLLNLAFALKEYGRRDDAIATLNRLLQVAPQHRCAEQAKRELELITIH